MAEAMKVTKAKSRIYRIEETHLDKLKEAKTREKLIDNILTEIDENYSKSRMLTEEELKKELGQVL